jgi:LPXTG-motif cell wall-anchored protein
MLAEIAQNTEEVRLSEEAAAQTNAYANVGPPSIENGMMGFDATEAGVSDNSDLTIMIAGILALGLMILIIRKKRKRKFRNNKYAS